MAKTRAWFHDPTSFLTEEELTLPPDPPGGAVRKGKVRIVDAYSQWVASYGAQFAYTEEIPKVNETDFDFALIIVEGNERIEVLTERFDFSNPPFVPLGGSLSPPIEDVFFGRLPIREASAGTDIASGTLGGFGIQPLPLPDAIDPERLVIVGLIDDSIHIGHRRFRDANNLSRVDFAWIHDAPWDEDSATLFGRELNSAQISSAIQEHPDDDDALMRKLGLIPTEDQPYLPTSLKLRGSHGTHVSDLATGYDPDDEDAVNRRIIAVQLPTFASQDTSGASLMTSIIAAARRIFDRALVMSEFQRIPIPVVLNFSYGFGGGPRNGKHIVERALRSMADEYRRETGKIKRPKHASVCAPAEFVLPAGNGHLLKTHAVGPAPQPDGAPSLDFEMRVQPDDRSPSFVEIWFSAKTKHIEVTVAPPNGVSKTLTVDIPSAYNNDVSLDNDFVLAEPKKDGGQGFEDGTAIARISLDRPNEKPAATGTSHPYPTIDDGTPFWRVVLALGPSSCLKADQPACPQGIWKVECRGDAHGRGPVRAWIQRDEAVGGFGTRGRQAYFDDTVYEDNRFDEIGDVVVTDESQPESIVKRDGTVSGIATNLAGEVKPLLAIGGALWDSDRAAVYSAAGNETERSRPHFLAPSDTSRVLTGIHASTTRNGGQVAMGGTSVAAPQAVRCLADALADLSPAAYATFDARTILQSKAQQVLRPDPQNPERAGNRRIREERVRCDHGLILPHPKLADQIIRRVDRKV